MTSSLGYRSRILERRTTLDYSRRSGIHDGIFPGATEGFLCPPFGFDGGKVEGKELEYIARLVDYPTTWKISERS